MSGVAWTSRGYFQKLRCHKNVSRALPKLGVPHGCLEGISKNYGIVWTSGGYFQTLGCHIKRLKVYFQKLGGCMRVLPKESGVTWTSRRYLKQKTISQERLEGTSKIVVSCGCLEGTSKSRVPHRRQEGTSKTRVSHGRLEGLQKKWVARMSRAYLYKLGCHVDV